MSKTVSKTRRNLTILALVLIVIILGYYGYSYYTQQQEAAKARSTVIIGTTDKITDLDNARTYDFFTWETLGNLNEGLLRHEPGTLAIVPGLADPSFGGGKGYEVSADGTVYTFKLRPNIKFTDGNPVDAAAVKYGIDRVVRIHDPQGVDWLVTSFVKSVDVVDPLTVKITLIGPVSYFPSIVALVPTYYAVDAATYPANEVNSEGRVGYGPYMIANWERDVELDLVANPNYYGTPPKTPNVVVKFFKDATTMRLALERGEIDVAWSTLNPTDVLDFKSMAGYTVIQSPSPRIRYIIFTNVEKPPDNDIHVRRALALALDRDAIVNTVFKGLGVPLYSMIPPTFADFHMDTFKDMWPLDLDKAKSELTAAGYSESNKLNVELWFTPSHYGDTEADVAAVIKQSWEKTGMVTVTLKSAEWGTYTTYIGEGTMPVYLLGWYPDYLDPDDYISPFYLSGNAYSKNYSNPQMDDLIKSAQITTDMNQRISMYQQMQQIAGTDIPIIPMFQGEISAVCKANVKGVVVDATAMLRYAYIYKE
jgi:peptide/nickel transport system substrate-binding protein